MAPRWPEKTRELHNHHFDSTVWDGGAKAFINKGANGRWRDVLTPEDSRRCETMPGGRLGEECATWLATGRRAS